MATRLRTSDALSVLLAASLAACNVFDESLQTRLNNLETDAGGASLLELANICTASGIPVVAGSSTPLLIPVSGLTSNSSEGGECAIARDVLARGDGFFQIQAAAGQRWHFHLDAASGQNLAIFASPSCDLRECAGAADVCGKGESEHFTFVADSTGSYVVVLDGLDPKLKEPLSLLAVSPTCGDGKKEHSEVCDDGNVTSGDGCDDACRVELVPAAPNEVEPNDDSYGANVLPTDAGSASALRVRGKIAGSCQPDYFLLRVSEPRTLTARILDSAGTSCSDAPALELALFEADRDELREASLQKRARGESGACPLLEGQVVQPGTYFLRLRQLEPAQQIDYQMALELQVPAAESRLP